jgi:hydrogenase maturation factor HypF (carbamoyltransferase family)
MCKCEKCGNNYDIPKNTTNFAYMKYCYNCQVKALRNWSKKNSNEIINSTAKSIGL